MHELTERIEALICSAIDAPDDRERDRRLDEIVGLLLAHPELDAAFFERYMTREVDEWKLGAALRILPRLGLHRGYDYRPLLTLLEREDVTVHYKRPAIRCITCLADRLDEQAFRDLFDRARDDLGWTVVNDTLMALETVRDRDKARRLLRRCLRETVTADERARGVYLDSFVCAMSANTQLYEQALGERLEPHEVVILAVSLLNETYPPGSPYRILAEQAAAKSLLAVGYLRVYVETYTS